MLLFKRLFIFCEYVLLLSPCLWLSPWPLVNLFWLTREQGPGVCSHRDLGRNVRLPPHLWISSSGDPDVNITALPAQQGLAHKEPVSQQEISGKQALYTLSSSLYHQRCYHVVFSFYVDIIQMKLYLSTLQGEKVTRGGWFKCRSLKAFWTQLVCQFTFHVPLTDPSVMKSLFHHPLKEKTHQPQSYPWSLRLPQMGKTSKSLNLKNQFRGCHNNNSSVF